jgi:hypothetical protein
MRILTELENDKMGEIYIENIRQNGKDIMVHLLQSDEHISGYYLHRINHDGISFMNDVGNVDNRRDFIKSIDITTDGHGKLKIVGIDLV